VTAPTNSAPLPVVACLRLTFWVGVLVRWLTYPLPSFRGAIAAELRARAGVPETNFGNVGGADA
jgi:hypothetical protein